MRRAGKELFSFYTEKLRLREDKGLAQGLRTGFGAELRQGHDSLSKAVP